MRYVGLSAKERHSLAWATRALLLDAEIARRRRSTLHYFGRGVGEILTVPHKPIEPPWPATVREQRQRFHREIRRAARLFAGIPS